jgi:hypothetical protein
MIMAVTPKVSAGYAKYLYEKDTEGKFASGKYKLEIRMPKGDEEVEKFVKKIMKAHADAGDNQYKPVKDGDNIKSESDKRKDFARGHYLMVFKSTRAPTCVDSKKNPLKTEITGGDVIKVAFNAKPYEAFGGGLALYLNAVQLIEKNGGGGVDEFGEEEGFVTESNGSDEFVETNSDGDF